MQPTCNPIKWIKSKFPRFICGQVCIKKRDKFPNSLTPCLAISWKQSCRDHQQVRGFVWGNPQASRVKLNVWAIDGWAPLWACRWNKRESGWVFGNDGCLGCIRFLLWDHHMIRLTQLFYLPVEDSTGLCGKFWWQIYSAKMLNLYQWFGKRPHNNPRHVESPQIAWAFPRGIPANTARIIRAQVAKPSHGSHQRCVVNGGSGLQSWSKDVGAGMFFGFHMESNISNTWKSMEQRCQFLHENHTFFGVPFGHVSRNYPWEIGVHDV